MNLLAREAHQNWDNLEEADAFFDQSIVAASEYFKLLVFSIG